MIETERTKRGELIFERIREMSMDAMCKAMKKNEPVPEYLILGTQETLDLADYCIKELHLSVFDRPGVGKLFGLTFISDERKILHYSSNYKSFLVIKYSDVPTDNGNNQNNGSN